MMGKFEGAKPLQELLFPLSLKGERIKGVRLMNWSKIEEYVLQFPHQQDVLVPKESVVHPQTLGIPFSWGAYRYTTQDERAIDIKDGDYWRVHWDKHNPSTHLIEHTLDDAPLFWLMSTTGIGAAISPEGKRGEGAAKGFAWVY